MKPAGLILWCLAGCAGVADATGNDEAAKVLENCRQAAREAFYEGGADSVEALEAYEACKKEGLK